MASIEWIASRSTGETSAVQKRSENGAERFNMETKNSAATNEKQSGNNSNRVPNKKRTEFIFELNDRINTLFWCVPSVFGSD